MPLARDEPDRRPEEGRGLSQPSARTWFPPNVVKQAPRNSGSTGGTQCYLNFYRLACKSHPEERAARLRSWCATCEDCLHSDTVTELLITPHWPPTILLLSKFRFPGPMSARPMQGGRGPGRRATCWHLRPACQGSFPKSGWQTFMVTGGFGDNSAKTKSTSLTLPPYDFFPLCLVSSKHISTRNKGTCLRLPL